MIQIPTISTPRLTLRPIEARDFADFADFYASDRSKFVGGPATAEQSWRMLATELGHWALRGYGRWAVEETGTGKLAGIIGPWNPEGWPEPELGWVVFDGFEGKGIAAEGAARARQWAYDDLGFTTLTSNIVPGNTRSVALAERLGARFERTYENVEMGEDMLYRHPAPKDAGLSAHGDGGREVRE